MAVSTLGILGQSAADLAAQIARYKRAGHITLRTLGEAREQARRHHERAMNYIASVRAELAGMAAIEAQEMDALGRDLAEAAVRNYDDAPGCHVEAPAMGPKREVCMPGNPFDTRHAVDGQGEMPWGGKNLKATPEMDGQGDPFVMDSLPTRLDAPTLNGEVLHSNGHGTYTVTPLPRPAHMEDAEARHAEAITAAEMDEAVERAGLAEGLAAKVGPPAKVRAEVEADKETVQAACERVADNFRQAADAARGMVDANARAATAGRQQQTRGKRRGAK